MSECLMQGAELEKMLYCLAASPTGALLCLGNVELGEQVMVETISSYPELEDDRLYSS